MIAMFAIEGLLKGSENETVAEGLQNPSEVFSCPKAYSGK